MANKPESSLYSIVEKAYFRLQAGDVLTHCLEDGTTDPVHELIQEFVVAGPQSLDALREILSETMKRKTQVYDDLNQVTDQLSIILKGYGINLDRQEGNQALLTLDEGRLKDMLDEQHILEKEARSGCLQVFADSRELINTVKLKIGLLESIERYLQDWLWGLTYQHIRQGEDEAGKDMIDKEVQ